MKKEQIHDILDKLEESRIINYSNGIYELKHDSLASILFNKRSLEEKKISEVIEHIKNTYTAKGTLNAEQLSSIKPHLHELKNRLPVDVFASIKGSIALENRKLLIKRISIILAVLAAFVFGLLLAIVLYFFYSEKNTKIRTLLDYANVLRITDYTKSFRLSEAAYLLSDDKGAAESSIINSYNSSNTVHFYNEFDDLSDSSNISSLSISTNDSMIAVGHESGIVNFWNINGKRHRANFRHSSKVIFTSYTSDGKYFVSASKSEFSIRNLFNGSQFKSHRNPNQLINISLCPSGESFLLLELENGKHVVKLFNFSTQKLEEIYRSPKGQRIFWAKFGSNRSIIMWIDNFTLLGLKNTAGKWELIPKSIGTLSPNVSDIHIDTTQKLIFVPYYNNKDLNRVIIYNSETLDIKPLRGNIDNDPEFDSTYSIYHSYQADLNGDLLAVARADNNILLKNVKSGSVKLVRGHEADVYSVQFTRGGDYIISASSDQTVKVWDREGNLLENLNGHVDYRTQIEMSRSNSYLVTTIKDKLRFWKFRDQKTVVFQFPGATASDISRNGRLVLVAQSKSLSIIEMEKMAYSLRLPVQLDNISSVEWSPYNENIFLVTSLNWCYVFLLDTATKRVTLLKQSRNHETLVETAHFTKIHGQLYVISCSACAVKNGNRCTPNTGYGEIHLWSVNSSNYNVVLSDIYRIYQAGTIGDSLIFSYGQDGLLRVIARESLEKNDKMIDFDKKIKYKLRSTAHSDRINYVEYNDRARMILTASRDRTISLWELPESGIDLKKKQSFTRHYDQIFKAHFSRDGRYIISCSEDGYVKLWETRTSQERLSLKFIDTPIEVKIFPNQKSLFVLTRSGTCQIKPVLLEVKDIIDEVQTNGNIRELSKSEKEHFGVESNDLFSKERIREVWNALRKRSNI